MPWWDEEDDVEVARPFTGRAPAAVEDEELWAARYPRIPVKREVPVPPLELSRRQRRRWVRNERRRVLAEEKEQRNTQVAGWRQGRPESARAGLGVVLVVIAALFAAFILWRSSATATSSTAASPSVDAVLPAPVDQAPSGLPSSASASPGPPAGDAAEAPAPPAALASPLGTVAYRFLIAYNTYDPAAPGPVATWARGFSAYASSAVTGSAPEQAPVLWADAAAQRVSVTTDSVGHCTELGHTAGEGTWECDVVRDLFPLGGDSSSAYRKQTARFRVTVTGADPRVSVVALLSTGSPS